MKDSVHVNLITSDSTMIFSLLLVPLVLSAVLVWWWLERSHPLRALPTALPTLPLLGHLHYLLRSKDVKACYADLLQKMASCGLDTYCMWMGPASWVFISRPEDVQMVLNSSKCMEKTGEYDLLKFASGEGIFTCKVSRWKMTRGPMQSLVHPRNLDHLVPGMNERSQALAGRLAAAGGCEPLNVYPTMFDFAIRNILSLAFGPDIEVDIDSEEFRILKEATDSAFKIFTNRLLMPWLQWDSIFYFLYGKQVQSLNDCWGFIKDNEKKAFDEFGSAANCEYTTADKEHDYEKYQAVVDIYEALKARYPQLTKKDLMNEVQTVIGGGTDTVTTGLSSCLLALAAHPHVQEKLYSEIVEVVGAETGTVTSEDIRNMPYLDCVLKESLRRLTVAPLIMRTNSEQIKLGDYTIPANTKIVINMLGQHMNSKIYPEPEKFDPERFAPENTAKRDRYSYVPFCAGPRDCIGKQYMLLVTKIAVVTLLRQFMLSTPDDINQLTFRYEVALVSNTGYNIVFHKRI